MNGIDQPHWTLNSCFGASRRVWLHLAMFRYYTKLGAKRVRAINAQVRAMKSFQNFSQRTHPIYPHWTLNLYFGASRGVWVQLAMFRYTTKLGVK